jgi:hypothetical protein
MARTTEPARSSSTRVETSGAPGLLGRRRDRAVVRAARERADGKLDEHFPKVARRTGFGTQTDTNLNAATANHADEPLGEELGAENLVRQNDHVDTSPSSSNSVRTTMRIAHDLAPASSERRLAPRASEKAFAKIVKIGSAHTQNATPPTLGREPCDHAAQLERGTKRLELAVTELILLDRVDACVWYDAFNPTACRLRAPAHRALCGRCTPRTEGTIAFYGNRARAKDRLRQCRKDDQIDTRARNDVERNGCAAWLFVSCELRPARSAGHNETRRLIGRVRVTPVKLRVCRTIYGTLILVIDHNR